MQKQGGDSPKLKITQAPDGQHGGAWTPEEIAELEKLVHTGATHAIFVERFPARTPNAVAKRLSELRRQRGVSNPREGQHTKPTTGPTILHPDDPGIEAADYGEACRKTAIASNVAFLAALERAQARAA
jgi:hypothetical protein